MSETVSLRKTSFAFHKVVQWHFQLRQENSYVSSGFCPPKVIKIENRFTFDKSYYRSKKWTFLRHDEYMETRLNTVGEVSV